MTELTDICPVCKTTRLSIPRKSRIGCLKCDWSIDAVPGVVHRSDQRLITQLTHERDGWKERALIAEEDDRGIL